jgi:cation diffusion facilitator CzcD-associated flavoprotein CzcO
VNAKSDVVVIGAGPYGLSAAAHLNAQSVNVRVFGETMSFWDRNMPEGMCLRSPWEASQISDPARSLTIDAFQTAMGAPVSRPIPIDRFVAYGRWFQNHAVPNLEKRKVVEIEKDATGFRVLLADGETARCGRVIIAGGIGPFAARPSQFKEIPQELASHSSEQKDLRRFRGRRVVVIGGGQSALESAALLHEWGADVELLVRANSVEWTWQRPWLHTFRPVGAVLYAWPDVGPAFISHAVARPNLYCRLPRWLQDSWRAKSVRANGVGWLKPRLRDVKISCGLAVVSAAANGNRVELKLSDGSKRSVNHVLMATGYRIDVRKYEFLSESLISAVRLVNGCPVLGTGFESSVPGLHFLGAPGVYSYGPLMRFVAGADFAARQVAQSVVRARGKTVGRRVGAALQTRQTAAVPRAPEGNRKRETQSAGL